MNTPESSTAEVKSDITEADIIAWLRSRAASEAIKGLVLSAHGEAGRSTWIAQVQNDNGPFGCGQTIAAAVDMIRPSIRTPEMLAEAKRIEAARLLAEADALVAPGIAA